MNYPPCPVSDHRPPPRGRWRRLIPPMDAGTAVLLGGGMFALTRGAGYLPVTSDGSIRQLVIVEGWAPLTVWAVIWLTVGASLVVTAWARRLSIVPLSLYAGLNAAWGLSYVWSWLGEGVARAWMTGAMFLAMAVWATAMPRLIERQER